MIHITADVSENAKIGAHTKIWHQAQVREGAVIGDNCIIGKNVYIDTNVKIGNNVKIQNNANVYGAIIEDDVYIGPGASFTNDMYPRAFIWTSERRGKITVVRKGASIGTNATLLSGIEIGQYSMVGAGSVVTRNIPAHALVFGVPAKLKGFVCTCGLKVAGKEEKNNTVVLHCNTCNNNIAIKKKDYLLE